MPSTKTIIPAGTAVRFIRIGSADFVLLPLGTTNFTNPTSPANTSDWVTIFSVETEIEYDGNVTAQDASNPPKTFGKYIGQRPTGR